MRKSTELGKVQNLCKCLVIVLLIDLTLSKFSWYPIGCPLVFDSRPPGPRQDTRARSLFLNLTQTLYSRFLRTFTFRTLLHFPSPKFCHTKLCIIINLHVQCTMYNIHVISYDYLYWDTATVSYPAS